MLCDLGDFASWRGIVFAGLARFLVAHNRQNQEPDPGWTREQVWETVRALIIEHLAVTEFTEDSRFVQDMHIDQ